jgi:hypothetical protein
MNPTSEPTETSRELVVFFVRQPGRCSECDVEVGRGELLRVERQRALCVACADLDHLDYLPRGDATLTRRARAHSALQAVVVEWSRSRKRYERQGVLVERAALEQAERRTRMRAEDEDRTRDLLLGSGRPMVDAFVISSSRHHFGSETSRRHGETIDYRAADLAVEN